MITGKSQLALLITVIIMLVSAWMYANHDQPANKINDDKQEQTITKKESEPEVTSINSKVLLAGETFWGRRIQSAAEESEQGTAFPFTLLKDFNKEQYNAWLAHIECPVTNDEITLQQQEDELIFNCKPAYLNEYSKWFDIVSLANNHTDNVDGQRGLDETRVNLEEHGIQHYGHYDNAVKDELCEIISLPVNAHLSNGKSSSRLLPIAMCGYHNVFKLPTEEELEVITTYSKYFLTIVTPQMGAEYEPTADQLKTSTYRAMVDRGADLVVATHPHWVQNSEVYNSKLIMYSIGNFMFDQEWSTDVKRGAALDMNLGINNQAGLKDWLALGDNCKKFKDNCLQIAKDKQLTKLNFDLKYDLVTSEFKDGQTRPASQATHNELLIRTNWAKTSQQLLQ